MAQTSLLQGKRFYCRDWVFHKIQHCLQEKTAGPPPPGPAPGPAPSAAPPPTGPPPSTSTPKPGAPWGVLLVGGPGSGKTAVATELLWPTSPQSTQRGLHRHALAFHFCRADDAHTLSLGGFVRGLVAQLGSGGLLPGYEEAVLEPAVQSALQPGECERNPSDAFKRYPSVCGPVCLSVDPPVCLWNRLSVCLPVCLSADPSVCLYTRLFADPSVCVPVCLSVFPSVCGPVCLRTRLSLYPSLCLCTRLSVWYVSGSCLSVCNNNNNK